MIRAKTILILFSLAFTLSSQDSRASEIETTRDAADAVDTSRWACALCPYPLGWTGNLDFGIGWVSDASNKFADYRGLDDDGAYPAISGDFHYRNEEGRFFDLQVHDAAIDSRRMTLETGVRGKYTARLGYKEIPKYRGFGTQTVFNGVGGDSLTLPANWQPAILTSEMTSLAQSLQPVDLQTSRKILDVGLSWRLSSRWSWEADFQHQDKSGTRPYGNGVFLIDASHLPAPVDYATSRFDVGLNYKGDLGQWRLGVMASDFSNSTASFTWENPFIPVPGTEILRTSLEPDNRAYHLSLAGASQINSTIRFSGRAVIGRMEQDDELLPYSTNPSFSDLPLPRQSADTRIDLGTLDVSGKLAIRLAPRLNLTARLQHLERDNKTPVDLWTPVITDLVLRMPRPNRPYSFERERASVSVRYRPGSRIRLQAGIEREDFERTLQSVRKTDENRYFIESRIGAWHFFDVRVRLEQADRDASPYEPVEDFALPEHPLTRKFNLADREQQRVQVDLDFFPTHDFSATLSYRFGEDDYDQSVIGLQRSEEKSLSLDLNWNPTSAFTATAFFSDDEIESTITGAQSETAPPWQSNSSDSFLTTGLKLSYRPGPDTEVGIDYIRSDADGDILTADGSNDTPFPTLTTELGNVKLSVSHQFNSHWGFRLFLEHERYRSTDWAIDGLGADGIPSILTFGAVSPDYDVTLIRTQAVYRF